MRSNFAKNVKKIKIDIRKEYDKLYEIYTEDFIYDFQGREYNFEMIFAEHFTEYHFAIPVFHLTNSMTSVGIISKKIHSTLMLII